MLTLILIGLVGGLITGISPCVLPVLPVIFLSGGAQGAQVPDGAASPGPQAPASGRSGAARRRPYLVVAGLALSFSVFTLLGTLVLSALPVPQDIIRWAGLAALVLIGIAMMFPRVQDLIERPFARIPQRRVGRNHGGFVLGLALGAVYVPCAGPVLAAITVAGATGRIGVATVALTVAFAIGTAIPLLFFALAGRGVAERVRVFRTRQRAVRAGAGVVLIVLAVALTFNVTDALQRAIPDYTGGLNRALDARGATTVLSPQASRTALTACAQQPSPVLRDCGQAPALAGLQQWFNTPHDRPLTLRSLRGKVVLVDFWAYSCINCQRAIAHVNAWYADYRKDGFVVIGVHTPEYAFEHVPANVAAGVRRLGIKYPVALDNKYKTWNSYGNDSWPADYLIDSAGTVRDVAIGEGDYTGIETLIRQLLSAARPGRRLPAATHVPDATPTSPYLTPETYLGADRARTYAGTGGAGTHAFRYPRSIPPSEWALSGTWTVAGEDLTAGPDAAIKLNFNASHVYLDVGGTGTITATVGGRSRTFTVSGAPDIYPLVSRTTSEHAIIEVRLSPGLRAYSFTFG